MRQIRKIFSYSILLATLSVHIPGAALFAMPTNSSPIALTSDDKYIWVVNPNVDRIEPVVNDTVTVHEVGADKNQKVIEIPVGDDPVCVALTPDNKKAYVTNHGSDTVTVIDALTYQVIKTITVGTEPFGCAVTPDGKKVYIANFSSDDVSVIRTSDDKVIRTIKRVGPKPRALAVSEDGKTVLVTLFLAQLRPGRSPAEEGKDDSKEGRVVVIDTKRDRAVATIALSPILAGFNSRGSLLDRLPVTDPANPDGTLIPTSTFPNLLQNIVIKGNRAYLPGTCSSPNGNARFNVNVQSCLSTIDINALAELGPTLNMNVGVGAEPVGKRLFNTNPLAIAFKHGTKEGFVALAATNRLLRVELDTNGVPTANAPNFLRIELKDPTEITQTDPNDTIGSKNPRGLVINSTDTRAYVMNLISRDVTVVDISGTDPTQYKTLARILSTVLPTPGSFEELVRRGHQLFNTAIGPEGTQENALRPAGRMSDFGWGSCYGCHPNGLTDGVTWMFGDGPRQTISMESTYEHPQDTNFLNANGGPLLPNFKQRVLNWSAVRDECQDFELNIRNVSGGQGLIQDGQAVVNLTPTSTTGRSAELDTLCAYIAFGIRAPISPLRGQEDPKGRELFAQANCQQCHGGVNWTSSQVDFTPPPNATEVEAAQLKNFLCDVGTFDPNAFNEVRAAGATQVNPPILVANGVLGFNIPSLLSVFAGAPYLHNGACSTLDCVLENVTHRSAGTNGIDTLSSPGDRRKVVRFLKTIDITTPTFPFVARPCQKP
jgi:YVTN family beta-propeller protein